MEKFEYKGWDLEEAIDALMAYDCGATDSGVYDPELKKRVQDFILNLSDKEFNLVLSKYARRYLTDEMLEKDYGLVNVQEAINWLKDLGIDL